MPRLPHGRVNISMDALRDARDTVADRAEDTNLGFAVVKSPDAHNFDFLFPELQEDDNNLLPETPDTVENLIQLGHAMRDTGGDDSGDVEISAAYTYFGQFVDHDITLGTTSADAQNLLSPDLAPLSLDEIRETTKNIRTAVFELDSVYNHPAPRDPDNRAKLRIGKVTTLEGNRNKPNRRPPGKVDENDLPRRRRRFDTKKDRAALIGDARNDENTIIAQLHLAFLLAHNKLIDEGNSFKKAQRILRQHYQYIVVHDFLKQIADPQIVQNIVDNGPRFYNPGDGGPQLKARLATDMLPGLRPELGEDSAERIRQREVFRTLKKLDLSPEEEEAIERLSYSLVSGLLLGPISEVMVRARIRISHRERGVDRAPSPNGVPESRWRKCGPATTSKSVVDAEPG